jgi:hypothetical protein
VNKWFFTRYDRGSESGLDYAMARYYDCQRLVIGNEIGPVPGRTADWDTG